MSNALSISPALPPQPSPQSSQQIQQPPQGAAGSPAAAPAPNHQQTVAALRHIRAIMKELSTLLKNPNLGKADIRSAAIDGASGLVADRIVPAGDAIKMLATFPDKPFDQKKWVLEQYAQNLKARDLVLAHHAQAFAGMGPQADAEPDNHMNDVASLLQHYGPTNA